MYVYIHTQVGQRAVLVPYRRKFVRRYHEWMKDPFLQGIVGGVYSCVDGHSQPLISN